MSPSSAPLRLLDEHQATPTSPHYAWYGVTAYAL
jgi:hypothetical protein